MKKVKKEVVNKPRFNKWIGWMYIVLTIFVSGLFIGISVGTDVLSRPPPASVIFLGLMIFVIILMAFTTASFYKTTYVVADGMLRAWSPFTIIRIRLKDIKSVERTRIPFHVRLYGASLYSGLFYIPSMGWVKSIMTNFSDGLLITMKGNKRYLITPSHPDKFMKLLK